jgi:hypothetical protein
MAELSEELDDLFQTSDESFEKILLTMLDEKGISTKTEIHKPLNLTRLETIAQWLRIEATSASPEEAIELIACAELIEGFVKKYRINMVSFNRKSRLEVIQALTEGLKEERSLADKLISKETKE